eukprot:scaffold100863_cov57-Phaeocystis_antarctica.AAC.4
MGAPRTDLRPGGTGQRPPTIRTGYFQRAASPLVRTGCVLAALDLFGRPQQELGPPTAQPILAVFARQIRPHVDRINVGKALLDRIWVG